MNVTGKRDTGRLLICDPVCAFSYGHNVAAMRNFKKFLGPNFAETLMIGSQFLAEDIAVANDILREFNYYYHDILPLRGVIAPSRLSLTHEDKLEAATRDMQDLIVRHCVTGQDTICFPSVDFYALYALADCAAHLVKAGSPTIMLRFIGVMENSGNVTFQEHEALVIALIQRVRNAGLTVKLAAETPRYAEYLAENLDCFVPVAANIEVREQVPLGSHHVFRVICPGSARYDKGFLELLSIFSQVRLRDAKLRIQFQTQIIPDHDLQHQLSYLSQLYAVPGVELLPSQLSAERLEAMYDDADLVLLPYAADVYKFRGSAVFIEAICVGRPVIALEGAAFADQIRYFRGGEICRSTHEVVNQIIAYSKISPSIREARARQARSRFVNDLVNGYREWNS